MPLALVIIAWVLIMTGIKGNYSQVGQQFQADVIGNGTGGFLSFMFGIVGIAAFFRILDLPGAGKVFLGLVLLVYLLQNESVLTTLQTVLASAAPSTAAPAATTTGATTPAPSASSTPTATASATVPTTGETSGSGSST
jgi:hypothetical protein